MKLILLRLYWRITRTYLRLRGAEVGHNVKCNGFPFVRIRKGGRLVIGDDVQINAAPWANAHVIAGSTNLFVAAGATLVLGKGVGLSGSRVVAMQSIEIEEGVLVGGGCLICDSDMHEVPLGAPGGARKAPIRIGARAFVGAGSMILKGVEIGSGSIVGAGSVITKDVPPNSLATGNPAQVLKHW